MSRDPVESYLDGDLDAEGSAELVRRLHSGGEDAAAIKAHVVFANLLGQALDATDGEAVVRGVAERLAAEDRASSFVRAVDRSVSGPRGRRAGPIWPRWAVAAGVLLALLGGLWFLRAGAAVPETICRVAAAGAGDRIVRHGAESPVEAGDRLYADDLIVCAETSTLEFADGTRVQLMPATRLRIGPDGPGKRLELVDGRIEAEVVPQITGRPCLLTTAQAEVEVVGTRFILAAGADSTRLEMVHGEVRVVRRSDGRGLRVRAGEALQVADGSAFAVSRDLFPASGLDGWTAQHGSWSNLAGMIRGMDGGGGKARLLSQHAYADLDLRCRVRVRNVDRAELQVGDYNWFFSIPAGSGGWVEVHLQQRGEMLSCTADGRPLEREAGDGQPNRPGPLGFYVMPGGTIEITEAKVMTP